MGDATGVVTAPDLDTDACGHAGLGAFNDAAGAPASLGGARRQGRMAKDATTGGHAWRRARGWCRLGPYAVRPALFGTARCRIEQWPGAGRLVDAGLCSGQWFVARGGAIAVGAVACTLEPLARKLGYAHCRFFAFWYCCVGLVDGFGLQAFAVVSLRSPYKTDVASSHTCKQFAFCTEGSRDNLANYFQPSGRRPQARIQ